MPFTVSHAAAVLPLARRGWPLALPVLVAGSMAPDVPYYLPLPTSLRDTTHSLPGAFTLDVALGALVLAVGALVAPPLAALVPVRARPTVCGWTAQLRLRGARGLLLAYAALVVGALTHVAWDAFTHYRGPVVVAFPGVLRAHLGPLPVFEWLQQASTVAGLAVVAVAVARSVRRTPSGRDASAARARARLVVMVVAGVAAAGALLKAADSAGTTQSLVWDLVTGGLAALGVALVAYALAFRAWTARQGG